jgi:hypothetical protein
MDNLVLLSALEVSVILKISKATIENWQYGRKKPPVGFPPGVKMGSCLRWRSGDIQKFIVELPFTTTGRIPTPVAVLRVAIASTVLNKPIRGRGRPRLMPTSSM